MDWVEAATSDGKVYYYHRHTRETCWELPQTAAPPPPALAGDGVTVLSSTITSHPLTSSIGFMPSSEVTPKRSLTPLIRISTLVWQVMLSPQGSVPRNGSRGSSLVPGRAEEQAAAAYSPLASGTVIDDPLERSQLAHIMRQVHPVPFALAHHL
jgi:hypothetical protein